MNLVISGSNDRKLRNAVMTLTRPRNVVRLSAQASRLEGVLDSVAIRTAVAATCDASRVDYAYLEEDVRFSRFKLLAMDMDSTLITIECIDEIADFAGVKKEISTITEAAMQGELTDFTESLRRRVALLAGAPESILSRVLAERLRLTEGAEELLSSAKRFGMQTALLSGGFNYFAAQLQHDLGIDHIYSNTLATKEGLITGELVGTIVDASQKARYLEQLMNTYSISRHECIVVGDGANDLAMMSLSDFSVAFHAKPVVRLQAQHAIKYGGFSVLNDWLS